MRLPRRPQRPGPEPGVWDVGPKPTARDVFTWFEQAWPNKSIHPRLSECVYVAQALHILRDVKEGRKRRKRNLRDEKAVTDVKTGAGVFLKHTPSVLGQLEAHLEGLAMQIGDAEGSKTLLIDERAYAFISETLDKVEQARKAVRAALEALKRWSAPYGEADRLLWIKRHMQEAWERTDGSRPRSTDENGSVVLFIQLALLSIDDDRKLASIARALRPSRAKRRFG